MALGIFRESQPASKVIELKGLLGDHCRLLSDYRRIAARWIKLRAMPIQLTDDANRSLLQRRKPSTLESLARLDTARKKLARMIGRVREEADGTFIELVKKKLALAEKEKELVNAVKGSTSDAKAIPIVGLWAENGTGQFITSVYLDPGRGVSDSDFSFRVRALVAARPAGTPGVAVPASMGGGSFEIPSPATPTPGLEIYTSPPIVLVDRRTPAGLHGKLVRVRSVLVAEFPDDPAFRRSAG